MPTWVFEDCCSAVEFDLIDSGRGANTGADQLDGGYRCPKRHVHGAARRAIQEKWLGCRIAAYLFELTRHPSDPRRRDRLFLHGWVEPGPSEPERRQYSPSSPARPIGRFFP